MKFGKRLRHQIEETLPEWRDKFLSYKDLKKKLKLIVPKNGSGGDEEKNCDRPIKRQRIAVGADVDSGGEIVVEESLMTKEEIEFMRLLEAELVKFNNFFVEKEEEYIIRLKELQDRVTKVKHSNCEETLKIRKEIVDFHGEMVLLENYSALNYTGLVKILKKYDKRTGALIRLPFIQRVLRQPFFTTDLLYKLVKECERTLDLLFPTDHEPRTPSYGGDERCNPTTKTSISPTSTSSPLKCPEELAEIKFMESLYMKSTISALKVLKELRSGSSTVSMFSLPPLQLGGVEETWNKIPVLEQAAK